MAAPCIVGKQGVERVIEFELDERESEGLKASADVTKFRSCPLFIALSCHLLSYNWCKIGFRREGLAFGGFRFRHQEPEERERESGNRRHC